MLFLNLTHGKTTLLESDHGIVAISGQRLDMAGYHDSRQGFPLANCESGDGYRSYFGYWQKCHEGNQIEMSFLYMKQVFVLCM